MSQLFGYRSLTLQQNLAFRFVVFLDGLPHSYGMLLLRNLQLPQLIGQLGVFELYEKITEVNGVAILNMDSSNKSARSAANDGIGQIASRCRHFDRPGDRSEPMVALPPLAGVAGRSREPR